MVRGSVSAVFPYAVLLIILIGKSIHISLCRHCLMKGCIKNNYLRNFIAEGLKASLDCENMSGIMKRSHCSELGNLLDNLIGNYAGAFKHCSALNYTVSDSGNLIKGVDNLGLALCHCINNCFKCLAVGGHRSIGGISPAVRRFMGNSSGYAYSFAKSLSQNLFVFHINKLIFKRRASCINYKYFHLKIPR